MAGAFLRTSGSGALAPTPQARWATGQYSNKLGSQGVGGPPSGPVALFSSSSPLRESGVSGLEGGRGSLPPCVCGWSGVCFFSSVWSDSCTLTLSQLHLGPMCSHFVLLPTQGRQPGIGSGKRRCCWPQGEGLPGWMECRYVAYRDIYFIMGGGTAPPGTSRGWEVCCQAHGPKTASLERWGL